MLRDGAHDHGDGANHGGLLAIGGIDNLGAAGLEGGVFVHGVDDGVAQIGQEWRHATAQDDQLRVDDVDDVGNADTEPAGGIAEGGEDECVAAGGRMGNLGDGGLLK